ncbi:cysteine hydrolase [Acidianus brierleyi]|uniref:Isochorismatase n=1 Tax=Acidianus brierleyi TaxID=41673 RepID=A0A2U9IBU3_9CREN|nr:cysteine hydrolase [Acidianus brierleyi]AWR93478.1 isochorismatase family protein [Acidianus brierleyi]
MIRIGSKLVYNTLPEIVNPAHTALIVWDVQTILVQSIFNREEFMKSIYNVLNSARRARVRIFFTRIEPLPIDFESPAKLYLYSKWKINRLDSRGLTLALRPLPNERVISKHSASIFFGTDFENMAKNAGIQTIVITGIATELGVESTVRDAYNRGFYSVVVKDAVSSSDKEAHERSLENMKKFADIVTSSDLARIWSTRSR